MFQFSQRARVAAQASTAKTFLDLYRDPTVAKNTSRSDFRIRDLMHYADPVSLYNITQPNDKDRLRRPRLGIWFLASIVSWTLTAAAQAG
jgi:type IV secretory pathway TraG/TraD family ATPase VirD4